MIISSTDYTESPHTGRQSLLFLFFFPMHPGPVVNLIVCYVNRLLLIFLRVLELSEAWGSPSKHPPHILSSKLCSILHWASRSISFLTSLPSTAKPSFITCAVSFMLFFYNSSLWWGFKLWSPKPVGDAAAIFYMQFVLLAGKMCLKRPGSSFHLLDGSHMSCRLELFSTKVSNGSEVM